MSSFTLPPPKPSNKKRKSKTKSKNKESISVSNPEKDDALSFLTNIQDKKKNDDRDSKLFKQNVATKSLFEPIFADATINNEAPKENDMIHMTDNESFSNNFAQLSDFPDQSSMTQQSNSSTSIDGNDGEEFEPATNDKLARKYVTKKIEKIDEKIEKYENKIKVLKEKKLLYLNQLSPNDQKLKQEHEEEKSSKKETETVNAIDFMKKGCSMLKYGRYGYPHFRHFELSENCDYIIWYSSSKAIDKSRIALASVTSLQKGQLTSVFKRHLQPRLATCSFSVIYDNGQKTLDVITKNKNAFVIWTKGLEKLIEYNQSSFMSMELPMEIPVKISKRSEESIEKRLSLQPAPPKNVVQRELANATKKFQKLMTECNNPKWHNIAEMDKVRCRIVELEQDIEKMRNSFNTKPLNIASHEIWRTSVELKALDNKIKAIAKTYK